MFNITGTGTVTAFEAKNDKYLINFVAHRSWTQADGKVQHSRCLFYTTYQPYDKRVLTLNRNDRISFSGHFEGEYNEKKSANGPHIIESDNGSRSAFELELEEVEICGQPAENQSQFEDILAIKLEGRIGRNAELRYTTDAKPYATASLAITVNKLVSTEGGKNKYDNYTIWFRISIFGERAETAAKNWTKGKAIEVTGHLSADQASGGPRVWKKKDGSDAVSYEMVVTTWQFALGTSKSDDQPVPQETSSTDTDEEIPF